MNIHVETKYLEYLENLAADKDTEHNEWDDNLEEKIRNFRKHFISNKVYVDDLNTIETIYRKIRNDNKPEGKLTFTERLIKHKKKQGVQNISGFNQFEKTQDLKDNTYHYFLKKGIDENEIGIAVKDENFKNVNYYNDYQQNHAIYDPSNLENLVNCKPPCNSLIIYDPYFLKPFNKKVDLFFQHVEIYLNNYKGINDKKFQLTCFIIREINSPFHNNITDNQIDDTINKLSEKNINAEFIILNSKLFSDRFFFTNYSQTHIGHMDRGSVFSQSIIGFGNNTKNILDIEKTYLFYIQTLYNAVKGSKINNQYFYNKKFTNRIFKHIKEQ